MSTGECSDGRTWASELVANCCCRDLFEYARNEGRHYLTCGHKIKPPDRASSHFHDSVVFTEVGQRQVVKSAKLVSLQRAIA